MYKKDFTYSVKNEERHGLTEEQVWKRWDHFLSGREARSLCQVLAHLVKQIGQGDRGEKSVSFPCSQAGNKDTIQTSSEQVRGGRKTHPQWQVTGQKSGGITNGRCLRIGGKVRLCRKVEAMRKTNCAKTPCVTLPSQASLQGAFVTLLRVIQLQSLSHFPCF